MDEDTMMYLAFSCLIILIVVANLSEFGSGIYQYIAVILCIMTIGVLMLMAFADFIIFPLLTGILGITFQPAKDYRITKSQEAVLKNVNGLYYATGYLTANLFSHVFKAEQVIQGGEERQLQAADNWERAVMSFDFPFKYHIIASALDIQQVRDDLEGKRAYQEYQLSRAAQSKNTTEVIMEDIRRNINVIQAKIDRITQEEKPVASVMYVETTAVGVSEKAALDTLADQIRRLQIGLGAFDVQLFRVVGRELYTLFQFNFALPTTYEELASNFDKQS